MPPPRTSRSKQLLKANEKVGSNVSCSQLTKSMCVRDFPAKFTDKIENRSPQSLPVNHPASETIVGPTLKRMAKETITTESAGNKVLIEHNVQQDISVSSDVVRQEVVAERAVSKMTCNGEESRARSLPANYRVTASKPPTEVMKTSSLFIQSTRSSRDTKTMTSSYNPPPLKQRKMTDYTAAVSLDSNDAKLDQVNCSSSPSFAAANKSTVSGIHSTAPAASFNQGILSSVVSTPISNTRHKRTKPPTPSKSTLIPCQRRFLFIISFVVVVLSCD